MASLKQFFVHYGQLFTGQAFSVLLGLISFPILTRLMTPEEYGMLGLVMSTMFLMVAVAKAGLSDGIIRFHKEFSDTEERRTIFSSTIIMRGLALAIAVAGIYLFLFPEVMPYLGIKSEYAGAFMVMSAYLFLRPMNVTVLNVLRANGNIFAYTLVNFFGKLTSIVLSLIIFIGFIPEVYGYFIGVALSEAVIAAALYFWYFRHYRVTVAATSSELAFELIKFGAPLLMTELAYLLLTYIDRYMIVRYYGEASLGLYSVGHNLAMYVGDAIMFPLSYAIIPIYVSLFQSQGQEATRQFLERCLHYLLAAVIPICVGYLAVSEELIVTLASQKYVLASTFSPVILLATVFLAANYILSAGLYLQKKTTVLLAIMLATVIVNVAANLILLPRYGIEGAAYAKLAATAFSSLATVALSRRYLFVHVNVKVLAYYLGLSALMYVLVGQIYIEPQWVSLIVKIIVCAIIIILGVLLREKELREILIKFRRKRADSEI
jgi:O-antigen/teichoic acid export membrane protein